MTCRITLAGREISREQRPMNQKAHKWEPRRVIQDVERMRERTDKERLARRQRGLMEV